MKGRGKAGRTLMHSPSALCPGRTENFAINIGQQRLSSCSLFAFFDLKETEVYSVRESLRSTLDHGGSDHTHFSR